MEAVSFFIIIKKKIILKYFLTLHDLEFFKSVDIDRQCLLLHSV